MVSNAQFCSDWCYPPMGRIASFDGFIAPERVKAGKTSPGKQINW